MGDEEQIKYFKNAKFFVGGSPIDMKPTENSFVIDQSDLDALDDKERHFDAHIQKTVTMTFEMDASVRQFVKQMEYELNKRLPRLPRKLKKKCKKTMFLRYPKRISKWMLLNVYVLNTKKTWFLKKNGITKTADSQI